MTMRLVRFRVMSAVAVVLAFAMHAHAGPTIVAIEDQPAPGGNGQVFFLGEVFDLNDHGEVAYTASYDGVSVTNVDTRGLVVSDGTTERLVARGGLANGLGAFRDFDYARLNDSGQVVAYAAVNATGSPPSLGTITLFDPGGGETLIARQGDTLPDVGSVPNGNLYRSVAPDSGSTQGGLDINNAGDVVYRAQIGDSGDAGVADESLYLYESANGSAAAALLDGGSADTGSTFLEARNASINDNALFAYQGFLTPGGRAVGTYEYSQTVHDAGVLVAESTSDPAGTGNDFDYINTPDLNNNDEIVLSVRDSASNRLIVLVDANGDFTVVADETTNAPDDGSTFSLLGDAAMNDGRLVAFKARTAANALAFGVYAVDADTGTSQLVIREGDPLFGSTLQFVYDHLEVNNAGQVAFSGQLADGRSFIAVSDPVPAPATALLLGPVGLALLRRRRRSG